MIAAQRGHAYGARATRLLAHAGLSRFGSRRIELMCAIGNVASQRVADAAGFTFEGISRGAGWYEHSADLAGRSHDASVYSMLEGDVES